MAYIKVQILLIDVFKHTPRNIKTHPEALIIGLENIK